MTSERFLGLDVVRTLAIGCVLLCHAIMLYGVLFPVTVPVAIASTLFGYYGVELFFALSGLLIGGILFQDVLPVPGVRSVGRFLLRRWLRILPAYYAVLAILLTVEWWRNGGVGVRWEYVFLVQNYNHGAEGFFPASWSLPIEQWAYILAPLALMVLPRLLSPWVKDQERQIWCSLGLVIGFFCPVSVGCGSFCRTCLGYRHPQADSSSTGRSVFRDSDCGLSSLPACPVCAAGASGFFSVRAGASRAAVVVAGKRHVWQCHSWRS